MEQPTVTQAIKALAPLLNLVMTQIMETGLLLIGILMT